MAEERVQRRLAAILAADVVGYSRLIRENEEATLAALNTLRNTIIAPRIAEHDGHIFKLMGDGILAEFPSAVEAVRSAAEIQRALAERNGAIDSAERLEFRIGVNLGDVVIDGDDLQGDGVNVASRLEGLAEPGSICISAAVFDQVRDRIELAFEDLGEQRVKNIERPVHVFGVNVVSGTAAMPAKRGVRKKRGRRAQVLLLSGGVLLGVVASLGAYFLLSKEPAPVPPVAVEARQPPLPAAQPAIAVLPFDNLSGDPAQEYFADGMTEDLITDLSQVSGLLVIARNSVFTYKGRAVKVQQVGKELGVQFVLEGSVRKIGSRVRINAQLVDASNGHHLWANRFDREITDVFALQDEVVKHIVEQLAVKLTDGEQERLNRTARVNPEAYDVLLRGIERFRRFTREDNVEARAYFMRAATIDPLYARAHADVALTYAIDVEYGWAESPSKSVEAALAHAQKALALDKTNPFLNFALGLIYVVQRRYDAAISVGENLTRLYPNYADGFAQLAQTLSYAGQPEKSLAAVRRAMRINPHHGLFYVWMVGHNYFLMERYETAIAELKKVVQEDPGFPWAHLTLASAYGLTGRIEDARWEAGEFLALQPDFTLTGERRRVLYRYPEHRERYIDGLRKAGMPE